MNRRDFYKTSGALGLGLIAGKSALASELNKLPEPGFYNEEAKKLPAREFDVVIAGGGTAGVIAAIASARQGAKTILVENKGYVGGVAVRAEQHFTVFIICGKLFRELKNGNW